jgi:hypothetical protein
MTLAFSFTDQLLGREQQTTANIILTMQQKFGSAGLEEETV